MTLRDSLSNLPLVIFVHARKTVNLGYTVVCTERKGMKETEEKRRQRKTDAVCMYTYK